MNNPNNLFNMMQTGGLTSTAGGTALARALQRRSDIKKLERQQRAEARRQKRGGLFGSIGSLAGGLLGAALTPFTGGASLALAAGLGAGLGRRAGEGLGAGGSRKYDREGTVFGQQAFRDVERASRDYTRGMGERALTSGLKTALSAYLNPTGMYGKVQGRLVPRVPNAVTPDTSLMDAYFSENLPDPSVDSVFTGKISPENMGGSFKGVTPKGYDRMASREFFKIDDAIQSEMSKLLSEQVAPMSLKDKLSYGIQDIKALGLPRVLGLGGKNFAENVRNQALLDNASLLMGQDIDEFAFLDDVQEQPNMQAPLLEPSFSSPSISQVPVAGGSSLIGYNQPILENFEDGGFLKLRRGAYVPGNEGFGGGANTGQTYLSGQAPLLPSAGSYSPFSVALGAGFELTPEQARLISDFDPSSIESAKSQYQQNLLGMTGGMGLSSMGGGFGARTRAGQEALLSASEAIGDVTSEAETQYESSVLGQMADLISGGAEFKVADSVPQQPPSNPGTLPGEQQKGSDGRNYIWTGISWMAT